jgi:hypothetical protein
MTEIGFETAACVPRPTSSREGMPSFFANTAAGPVPVPPLDELEPLDELDPLDELELLDEPAPLDELELLDEPAPLDELELLDDPAPLDELELLDELDPLELLDEAAPLDELELLDELEPLDELDPVVNAAPDPPHAASETDAMSNAVNGRWARGMGMTIRRSNDCDERI